MEEPSLPPPPQNILIVKLLFPVEYGLFLVLNLLDIFLSLVVFHLGGYEVNRVADYFLRNWGRLAFVVYKLILVFLVIGLAEYIGRRRRSSARLLLWFAIAMLTVVVIFGGITFYRAQMMR